ncbi:SsrA-binding protein [Frankliniella fusca]|uniref:SsrA-binding protein n=1 Tax=Frankliniella fusca TaxID=407009 RepID=A0AAE1I5D6_9NEOP|nr:SsrA-binding protein [Frankliniella fusca]
MDVTATLQRPEIQALVNKITSVPSSTNYCLAFWVNTNISESNARLFAGRLWQINGHVWSAYLDIAARPEKRRASREALAEALQIPKSWQIDRIHILHEPTAEFPTAFSLLHVHFLIAELERSGQSKSFIIDVLTTLVLTAFTPSAPVTPSAPPPDYVDLVSPVTGDKSSALPRKVEKLHEEIKKTVGGPTPSPRKSNPPPPPEKSSPPSPPPRTPTPPPDHDDMATFQAPLVMCVAKFAGRSGEDVEAYFTRLENALHCFNIPTQTQRCYVIATTEGIAGETVNRYLQQHPDCSFDDLKRQLIQAFKRTVDSCSVLQLISSRTWRPDEHLQGYVQEMLSLCSQFDKDLSTARQIEFIKQGLPGEIQLAIMATPFSSVDELVKRVDTIAQNQARIKRTEALRMLSAPQQATVSNIAPVTVVAPAPAPAAAPAPAPGVDPAQIAQMQALQAEPTDYYSALSAALFHSPKGAPALRELCASYLLTQTGHTSASAPQQVLCQENQPSSEAQPGPDPAPRPLSSAIAEIFKVTIHLKDPQGNVETFAGGDKEVVFVNQLDNGKYTSVKYVKSLITVPQKDAQQTQRSTRATLRRGLLAPHMQERNGGQPDKEVRSYVVSSIAAPREPTPSQHEHQCPLHQLDTPPTTQLDLANTKLIVFDTIINGRTATTLFDPGSEFDLVKPHLADPAVPLRPIAQQPAQADSSPLAVLGITRARFALGPINTDYDFYVSPAIFYDAIAGKGWARHFACTSCWTCDKLLVRLHGARVLLQRAPEPPPPGQQQVHT